MPLRRSPPSSASITPQTKRASPMAHSSSVPNESDLVLTGTDENYMHNTQRNSKRQRLENKKSNDSDPLNTFMSDIKTMFLEFKEQQNKNIDKIYDTVEKIKIQNESIQESINYLSEKYETLNNHIKKLETENINNLKYIQNLENRLERNEQIARSTCIEIRNIPSSQNEVKENIISIVTKISDVINEPLEGNDIKDTFRISTKNNPSKKTIIVEFTSNLKKEKFIKMYKKHIKNKGLSSLNLGINGPDSPIYISENLSAKQKRLFYVSRDFAKSNGYRYCWVNNGKIFLRKQDGAAVHLIREEADIVNIKKSI